MGPLLQYLQSRQRQLRGDAEILRVAAEEAGRVHSDELVHSVTAAYRFLFTEVVPWQAIEERYLIPAVATQLGAEAAAELTDDHRELSSLAEQLGALRDHIVPGPLPGHELAGLQRVLYAAYELLRSHLGKEERLLPALARGLGNQERVLAELRGELAGRA